MDQDFYDEAWLANMVDGYPEPWDIFEASSHETSETVTQLELDTPLLNSESLQSQKQRSLEAPGVLQIAFQPSEAELEPYETLDGHGESLLPNSSSPPREVSASEEGTSDIFAGFDPLGGDDFFDPLFNYNLDPGFNCTDRTTSIQGGDGADNTLADINFDLNVDHNVITSFGTGVQEIEVHEPLANIDFDSSVAQAGNTLFENIPEGNITIMPLGEVNFTVGLTQDYNFPAVPNMSLNYFLGIQEDTDINSEHDLLALEALTSIGLAHANTSQPVNDLALHRQSQDMAINLYSQDNNLVPKRLSQQTVKKRPRSSDGAQNSQLIAFQQDMLQRKGIPASFLSNKLNCDYKVPLIKRKRTEAESANKKDVEAAGGACFLCQLRKAKCSSERPCQECTKFWRKLHKRWDAVCRETRAESYTSTDFQWTCDVSTKLSDLIPIPMSGLEAGLTLEAVKGIQLSNCPLDPESPYSYLIEILDILEPDRISFERKARVDSKGVSIFDILLYSSKTSRHLLLFTHLIPDTHNFLQDTVKRSCMLHWIYVNRVDMIHKHKTVRSRVGHVYLIMSLIHELTVTQYFWEAPVFEHAMKILKAKLQGICAMHFENQNTFLGEDADFIVLMLLYAGAADETRVYLPPRLHRFCKRTWVNKQFERWPFTATKPLDTCPCLAIRTPRLAQTPLDEDCTCGWAFDCVSPGILRFFSHSRQSFKDYVHSSKWCKWSLINDCLVPAPEGATTKSEIPSQKEDLTFKTLAILRFALLRSIQRTLSAITKIISMPSVFSPSTKDYRYAQGYRRLLLVTMVEEAFYALHLFFKSAKEGEIRSKNIVELCAEFSAESSKFFNNERVMIKTTCKIFIFDLWWTDMAPRGFGWGLLYQYLQNITKMTDEDTYNTEGWISTGYKGLPDTGESRSIREEIEHFAEFLHII